MTARNNIVRIRMKVDWKEIPKGTQLKAKSMGFGCVILEAGEHHGKAIGAAKYKVLKVLIEETQPAGKVA